MPDANKMPMPVTMGHANGVLNLDRTNATHQNQAGRAPGAPPESPLAAETIELEVKSGSDPAGPKRVLSECESKRFTLLVPTESCSTNFKYKLLRTVLCTLLAHAVAVGVSFVMREHRWWRERGVAPRTIAPLHMLSV